MEKPLESTAQQDERTEESQSIQEATDDSQSSLSKFVQITPALSIVIVLFGFFNIYSYYLYFGIDITSYVEPSEIIFSFSSLFFSLTFLICTVAVFSMRDLITERTKDWKPKRKFLKVISGVLVFILMSLSLGMVNSLFPVSGDTNSMLDFFRIIALLIVFYVISSVVKSHPVTKHVITLAVALLILLQRNHQLYSSIVNEKRPFYNVKLKLTGSKIQSNDSLLYIGSSNQFIFFWNTKSKSTSIYPLREMLDIEIKKNEVK